PSNRKGPRSGRGRESSEAPGSGRAPCLYNASERRFVGAYFKKRLWVLLVPSEPGSRVPGSDRRQRCPARYANGIRKISVLPTARVSPRGNNASDQSADRI